MDESKSMAAASKSELRNQLIDKIQHGLLEPEEAEQEAKLLGLEPLCPKPDPDAFDPMPIQDWTLLMALAWIMFRDADPVRQVWDEYRRKSYRWHSCRLPAEGGQVREGFFLRAGEPAELDDLQVMETYGEMEASLKASMEEAKADLLRQLRAGHVHVTGIPESPHEKRERVQIPPYRLKDLDLYSSRGGIVLRDIHTHGVDPGFKHVLTDRADVIRHWSAAEARRAATVDKIAQCKEWLVNLIRSGAKEKSKKEYKAEAMSLFEIGPYQFDTVWQKVVEKEPKWSQPGRPKGKKKKSSDLNRPAN
jgi:hypothetical protein